MDTGDIVFLSVWIPVLGGILVYGIVSIAVGDAAANRPFKALWWKIKKIGRGS